MPLYDVDSCHNNSLPGFHARLATWGEVEMGDLTGLHEPCVDVADSVLVEAVEVIAEYRRQCFS